MRKETYWSKFAKNYDKNTEYVVGKDAIESMRNMLARETNLGVVLELGCGTGLFTKVLSPNASSILATDLSDEMLEITNTELSDFNNISTEKVDARSLPYDSGSFNTVVITNTIHVVKEPEKILEEAYRVLTNDGTLLIISYSYFGVPLLRKLGVMIRFVKKFGIPKVRNNFSINSLSKLITSHNYKIIEGALNKNKKINFLFFKAVKELGSEEG